MFNAQHAVIAKRMAGSACKANVVPEVDFSRNPMGVKMFVVMMPATSQSLVRHNGRGGCAERKPRITATLPEAAAVHSHPLGRLDAEVPRKDLKQSICT